MDNKSGLNKSFAESIFEFLIASGKFVGGTCYFIAGLSFIAMFFGGGGWAFGIMLVFIGAGAAIFESCEGKQNELNARREQVRLDSLGDEYAIEKARFDAIPIEHHEVEIPKLIESFLIEVNKTDTELRYQPEGVVEGELKKHIAALLVKKDGIEKDAARVAAYSTVSKLKQDRVTANKEERDRKYQELVKEREQREALALAAVDRLMNPSNRSDA